MKNTTLSLLLLLGTMLLPAAETVVPTPPGTKASYETARAKVLKVYASKEGKHRFIAYVVKWKGDEVIVSDPLARSDHKAGDMISFIANKVSIENDRMPSDALAYVLTEPPPR